MILKHHLKLFIFLLSSATAVGRAMEGKGNAKQDIECVSKSGDRDFQQGV